VLLYAPPATGARPASAGAALRAMLPRSTVSLREPLGLYWEVYGLAVGDSPQFELTMAPADSGSGLSALVRGLGLARQLSSTSIRFSNPEIAAGEIGADRERAFSLTVAMNALRPGMYIMELATRVAGKHSVSVRRQILVTR
jgi:hypothetical protein